MAPSLRDTLSGLPGRSLIGSSAVHGLALAACFSLPIALAARARGTAKSADAHVVMLESRPTAEPFEDAAFEPERLPEESLDELIVDPLHEPFDVVEPEFDEALPHEAPREELPGPFELLDASDLERRLAPAPRPEPDAASDAASDAVSEVRRESVPPSEPPPAPAPSEPTGVDDESSPLQLEGQCPSPVYPKRAVRRGLEGAVVLRVTVGVDGDVAGVVVLESSGHDSLDEAALEAVRQWRYLPGTEDGVAVEMDVDKRILFRIPR